MLRGNSSDSSGNTRDGLRSICIARGLSLLVICACLAGCGVSSYHRVRSDPGMFVRRTYVNQTYGFRFVVPLGWVAENAPWYAHGTLVTFQAKDNATSGKVVVFSFNPKRHLTKQEKRDKMIASLSRQLYPMHQVGSRRLIMPWGDVLEVIYDQQVESRHCICKVWLVTNRSLGYAIVCRTSGLLYVLVKDEINRLFSSFRLLEAESVGAEVKVASDLNRKDLRDSIASLKNRYVLAVRRVLDASTGDGDKQVIDGLSRDLEVWERDITKAKQLLARGGLEQCAALQNQLAKQLAAINRTALKEGYILHTIRCKGETLFAISKWFTGEARNWQGIRDFNDHLDPNALRIGDEVKIPLYLSLKTRDPMKCNEREKPRLRRKHKRDKRKEEMEPVGPK
ncbi:MAG TPA: LysM domain-containing protein [bacterium]|nr:LysM domain-containing protein [bacterium]